MFDFDTILDRKNTKSIKWDFTDKYFGKSGILPMWVADMDFASPPAVTEALIKRANHPAYGYTGYPRSMYEAVRNWMKNRHNWNIPLESISSSPGVVPGLTFGILEFSEPGDKIIIQEPVYYPFASIIKNNDRQISVNPLRKEGNNYVMDFEHLKSIIDEKTRILILCSPHNPVGRVWRADELNTLAEICIKHNILIFSDEIHMDIIYEGYKHIPIASLGDDIADITLTFTAPSKTFNIAGLSASNVIITDEENLQRYNNRKNGMGFVVTNLFGTEGIEAAYRYGHEWLDELLVYLQSNIDYIEDAFRNSPIDIIRPEGTYLLWMDFNKLGMDDEEIKKRLLEYGRIALDPGNIFGQGGTGFQRINFACPKSVLKEGVERIRKTFL